MNPFDYGTIDKIRHESKNNGGSTKFLTGPTNGNEVTIFEESGNGVINSLWVALRPASGITSYPAFDLGMRVYNDNDGTPSKDLECDNGLIGGYPEGHEFAIGNAFTRYWKFKSGGGSGGITNHNWMTSLPIYFTNGIKITIYNATNCGGNNIYSNISYAFESENPNLNVQKLDFKGSARTFQPAGGRGTLTDGSNITAHQIDTNNNGGRLLSHSIWGSSGVSGTPGVSWLERPVSLTLDGVADAWLSSGFEDWGLGTDYFLQGESPHMSSYGAMNMGVDIGTNRGKSSFLVDLAAAYQGIPFEDTCDMILKDHPDISVSAAYASLLTYYEKHSRT